MGAAEGTGPPQIPVFDLRIEAEDIEAVADCLRSGWWTMGPRVEEFERAFAEHLGVEHVVALSSCTAALHLALASAGVGPGDEVIVPAYTFVATAAAVVHAGAVPVFADIIAREEPSIDPDHVESLIGPRTRAVIPVHYAGYAAPVDRLRELCDRHGLTLIEDSAHAPIGELEGRALGTHGRAGCFSFFSNKILVAGEGGALATDDADLAARARLLRSQGMTAGTMDRHLGRANHYDVIACGRNYRLDEPRAALLLARLPRLAAGVERRRALTRRYRNLLSGLENLVVPYRDEQVAGSACYLMSVYLAEAGSRDEVRTRMREAGVGTSVTYPGIHTFTAYRSAGASLPRTELAADTQITLPLFAHLTEDQVDRSVAALAEATA